MKLVAETSPYIRKNVSVARMMLDVVIALLPVTLFAMIQNGWRGVYVFLISIATMIFFELLCHMFIKWPKGMKFKELFTKEGFLNLKSKYTINNILAPLISAMIYSLILPAGTKPYVVFVGAVFGIVVGKMVFGGLGNNIFNPAAVGRIFVSICFTLSYDKGGVDVVSGGTPLALVKGKLSNISGYGIVDLLIGNVPGSMGEVCSILIIIGAAYLIWRRSADIRAMLGYYLSFAIIMFVACFAFYFKESKSESIWSMWAYQLLSGGALFAAAFMITDPVTSPVSKFGRTYYAVCAGLITGLIRICGSYPEGAAFSILIMNMFTPCIDYFMRGKPNQITKIQWLIMGGTVLVLCGIITAYICMGGMSL